MILILTYQHYEQGTDPVVDWLVHWKVDFLRLDMLGVLNGTTSLDFSEEGEVFVDGINLSEKISVVFYRRFFRPIPLPNCSSISTSRSQLANDLYREAKDIWSEIFRRLKNCIWCPDMTATDRADNKLLMNAIARKAGLKVPKTIICNTKKTLLAFLAQNPSGIICKPINFCGYYFKEDFSYTAYTKMVDEEFLDNCPAVFFPTLFQGRIRRDYEIRTFYLDGSFYPTAIYANDYDPALADVKLIAGKKSTHNLPCTLPSKLCQQLDVFMKSINLVTGSVDILKDPEDNYYFIEVNPVGQYLAPSKDSNYLIEKKIALWLVKQMKKINHPSSQKKFMPSCH